MLGSLALAAGAPPAKGETTVVVTAGLAPVTFSAAARSVTVLTRADIEASPAASVADLLALVAGVDVRPRGPQGVQADLAMRGSTFEQVLVLLDGIKVGDPQTGHHDLDLPVALEEVERIEVLRGAAARLYGPDAYAGVVNILTRRPGGEGVRAAAGAGEHGLVSASGGLAGASGAWGQRLSASLLEHDGYRHNTAADLRTASWRGSWESGTSGADLFAGWTDKRFGANGYYSDRYPEAWEHTATGMAALSGRTTAGGARLEGHLSWRRHDDTFLLDRSRPSFYRNEHRTDLSELSGRLSFPTPHGLAVMGLEAGRESIASDRLGDRSRHRGGLYFEQSLALGARVDLSAGASLYRFTGWGWHVWPGADLGVDLGRGWRGWLSVGKAFRVPTYTDLYYTSPTDQGNPALRPEESWSYEAGARWSAGAARAELSLFRRDGDGVIDFVRAGDSGPWTARNLSRVRTRGAEVQAGYTFAGSEAPVRLQGSYTFLDSEGALPAPYHSKYALAYLRHQACLSADHRWGRGVSQRWEARYESRLGYGAYWLLDARLTVPLKKVELVLDGTNLLNTPWPGAGFAPMPGRWVTLGVRFVGH